MATCAVLYAIKGGSGVVGGSTTFNGLTAEGGGGNMDSGTGGSGVVIIRYPTI